MRDVLRLFLAAAIALGGLSHAHAAAPQPRPKPLQHASLQVPAAVVAPPRIAVSGLPVPRWVSVRAGRVNVRRGPSFDQEVLWTYVRTGVPVEVIAEYDTWRRIRDASGETGWVKAAMLDGRRTVALTGRVNTAILSKPAADGDVVALASPGLQAKLVGCAGAWCEIQARGYSGFVERDRLWGVYPTEEVR